MTRSVILQQCLAPKPAQIVGLAADKVGGVRADLTHDPFSAYQGVEDDDLTLICLDGLMEDPTLGENHVHTFLTTPSSDKARHRSGLGKVAALENQSPSKTIQSQDKTDRAIVSQTSTLKLHLLRHGETAWSVTGQHTGRSDIPLTANGEDEARTLGRHLCGIPFSRVFTSPLKRARQTCDLVALSRPTEIEPDLAEWDYGDYEGQLAADILRERPEWTIFHDGAPHGESPGQIATRADRLLACLRTMTGNIALFTHGHFGRVLAARWIGLSVEQSQPFLLSTASHSILSFEHNQPDQPAIEQWNAVPSKPLLSTPGSDTEVAPTMLKHKAVERWENEGGEIQHNSIPLADGHEDQTGPMQDRPED